jgi:hypothetical protein
MALPSGNKRLPSAYGKPSSWGGSRAKGRTLVPWGNNYPMGSARGANALGATPFRSKVRSSGAVRKPTPDPSLWGMTYKPNDPVLWPVLPDVNASPPRRGGGPNSGMNQAKADFNNAVVNHAFQRAGYAG